MNNKLLGALSMCRRAGGLVMGFDAVKESVQKGKAYLVLVASDLSPNTLKRVGYFCEDFEMEYHTMPVSIDDLLAITPKAVGVFAITDGQLAKLVSSKLTKPTDQ
ncbi:MAG: ribosomal L7Ae/L30e/S12e/Gadd45 family protein [Oscillospiraceae bacterium]|nr:ribosomal L7Ae/L30e/S12e/Gadd45 family protein [Oscillospiraceae bacterium]